MKIVKYGLLIGMAYLFNGCVGQPYITESEVSKYEKVYLEEYNTIKGIEKKEYTKWIQAINKKENCKVFVGYNPNDDRTKKIDYKIFWDGGCKNGYAYGLGREFEKSLLTDMEAIAVYDGTKTEPEYYYQNYKLNNVIEEGNLNHGYSVATIINDDGINLDIKFRKSYHNKESLITYGIENSPFSDDILFFKGYPNFGYTIRDFTNNTFDNRKYEFNIIDKKSNKVNGFIFAISKNGEISSLEVENENLIRRVELPKSYLNNIEKIFNEIRNTTQNIQNEQQKASIIKTQYKNKICKSSVKVDFMDNGEYKAICEEDKRMVKLKTKIDAKLVQINQLKQTKREQISQERLIRARESEAMSAQRRAVAMEQANFNQSMQDINNNFQMQQLNNNIMMYNLMPKRYDLYLH